MSLAEELVLSKRCLQNKVEEFLHCVKAILFARDVFKSTSWHVRSNKQLKNSHPLSSSWYVQVSSTQSNTRVLVTFDLVTSDVLDEHAIRMAKEAIETAVSIISGMQQIYWITCQYTTQSGLEFVELSVWSSICGAI